MNSKNTFNRIKMYLRQTKFELVPFQNWMIAFKDYLIFLIRLTFVDLSKM